MTSSSTSSASAAESLSKAYDPQAVEPQMYALWEEYKLFRPEAGRNDSGKTFSLVIPPPNVTGVLHMGHALDNTLQDILIRWHRMQGDNTLWMPGTDHAGIATQNVVERNLRQQGQSKEALGREAFLKLTWDWAHARKGDILNQFKRLGISPDWDRQRFTLDEGLCKAVRKAFVTLYERGLIYRGMYIVNWCPRCTSAISDIETEYQDEESFLWEIAYPLSEGPGNKNVHELVVATTRPETMYGDVAVAVNPNDTRYKQFIGKTVRQPITNRDIPVIADDYVDTSFGTGVLKITPAHDPNDCQIGLRHGLTPLWAMDERGCLKALEDVPEALHGLDRFTARQETERLLIEGGFLVRKLPHAHRVGHCQRCSTTIEPLLSMQWFMKTKDLANQAIDCVNNSSMNKSTLQFMPPRWTKDFLRWMTDIQDWCISRQLWWGHQIPAWHCATCGQLTVTDEDPTECSHCQSSAITQDTDVLDTWFSSGLWPFSTMNWPDLNAPDFKTFYPTNVLVTGFDIIFFWVARMVMFGLALTDRLPFETVYIHGLVRDEKGQKMSKSKGNTVDPVELIETYGCDGFRFALTSLVTFGGQDIKLSLDRFEQGKLFANKLWNAARFVLMNIQAVDDQPIDMQQLSLMDRWLLSTYHQAVQDVNGHLQGYRFGELAMTLYEFTWNVFCDWYVEYAKKQLRSDDAAVVMNTQRVLRDVLSGILRLLHPMMPHITEAIWQQLPHRQALFGQAFMIQAPFPTTDVGQINPTLNQAIAFVIDVVRSLRNIKQQYNVPPATPIDVVIETDETFERQAIEDGMGILSHFITLTDLKIEPAATTTGKQNGAKTGTQQAATASHAAVQVIGHSRVRVPLEGLIDLDQERQRLEKKQTALKKEETQLYQMLSNYDFLERAPEAVVEKNKARLSELKTQLHGLDEQLKALG